MFVYPGTTRVAGNKKGILTRNRQPKRVAYVLRERYRQIPSLNLEAGTKRYAIEPANVFEEEEFTDYWRRRNEEDDDVEDDKRDKYFNGGDLDVSIV